MINYSKYNRKLVEFEKDYSYLSDDVYYFNVHRKKDLILKLQKRIEYFDTKLISSIIKKALGQEVENFEVSKFFGTGHIIIFVNLKDGKQVVLRTNLFLDEPEHYMDLEKDFSNMYKSVGIPSSTILYSDTSRKSFPFDYQIMEYLKGRDLEQEWDGSKEEYDKISYEMGVNTAKLYSLQLRGWGRLRKDTGGEIFGVKNSLVDYMQSYLEHDLKIVRLFELVSTKSFDDLYSYFFSEDIKKLFGDVQSGCLLLHDPSDHNMRYIGNQISAVFDWENAVSYDPICEIGSAPTWKTHYPRKEIMSKGFIETLGYKPANFEQKSNVHYLRKIIDKVQFALKGERLSQRHIDLFNDACKVNNLDISINI